MSMRTLEVDTRDLFVSTVHNRLRLSIGPTPQNLHYILNMLSTDVVFNVLFLFAKFFDMFMFLVIAFLFLLLYKITSRNMNILFSYQERVLLTRV